MRLFICKRINWLFVAFVCLMSFSCICKKKAPSKMTKKNPKKKSHKLHTHNTKVEMYYELDSINSALFAYYIDNNRFPSEKEGIVYALSLTGKNKPYFKFEKKRIVDKNREHYSGPIKKGLYYTTPFRNIYTYKNIGSQYHILGDPVEFFRHNDADILKFDNLSKLKYKKTKYPTKYRYEFFLK